MQTNEIIQYFANKISDEAGQKYLSIHAKRYSILLGVLKSLRNNIEQGSITILDIGPSFFTELLYTNFPNDRILTLGFTHPESTGGHLPKGISIRQDNFINFNLNNAQVKKDWINLPHFSIVVIAEVIEHLYTAPTLVLDFLRTFLDKDGYCVLQTPNAVSLDKRLRMLSGSNPFELIRENNQNPGHFREYTKKDILTIAKKSKFQITNLFCSNYFALKPITYKVIIYRFLQIILGKSLYDGITAVLKNTANDK